MAGSSFPRVSQLKRGYHPHQVDEFMARAKREYAKADKDRGGKVAAFDDAAVRRVAFKLVRGGYDPHAVDRALDRLEAAFIHRERAQVIAEQGEKVWLEAVYSAARSLYPRMKRPHGRRFSGATGRGYHKGEVDQMIDKASRYFSGKGDLSVDEIRACAFSSAKGTDAYDEAVVDAYLDRLVGILLAVD